MSLSREEREIAAQCADQYPPGYGSVFFQNTLIGGYEWAEELLRAKPDAWESG